MKDGLSTGPVLDLPKSNWALPIDKPPFLAVKVACEITFTFGDGDLAIDPESAYVLSEALVLGLFCMMKWLEGRLTRIFPEGLVSQLALCLGGKLGTRQPSYI